MNILTKGKLNFLCVVYLIYSAVDHRRTHKHCGREDINRKNNKNKNIHKYTFKALKRQSNFCAY